MGSLQRHLIGIAAVVLGTIALVVGLGFGWTDNTGSWTMGTFGKVAFVLAIMWLAWPQMLRLKELPGGGVALVSVGSGNHCLSDPPTATPLFSSSAGFSQSLLSDFYLGTTQHFSTQVTASNSGCEDRSTGNPLAMDTFFNYHEEHPLVYFSSKSLMTAVQNDSPTIRNSWGLVHGLRINGGEQKVAWFPGMINHDISPKTRAWLESQLDDWQTRGLMSAEQAVSILGLYASQTDFLDRQTLTGAHNANGHRGGHVRTGSLSIDQLQLASNAGLVEATRHLHHHSRNTIDGFVFAI